MNAAELLDKLNRAGATLEIVEGKPRLRGTKVPEDLVAALKANRDAVLAEFERRQAEDRDRFCRVPAEDVGMFGRDLELPPDMRRIIESYACRQGRPAQAWVMKRAEEYFKLGVPAEDCDWRACVDLIAWQRHSAARGAVEFVAGLNDACEDLKQQ